MKKCLILILVFGFLFLSCTPKTGNTNKPAGSQDAQGTVNTAQGSQNNTNTQDKNAEVSNNNKPDEEIPVSSDASVEVLLQLAKDFLFAAYDNNTDDMANLCSEAFAEKISSSPKLYVGTKPDYAIEKIDTIIKPLEYKGKYILESTVTAIKKSNKIKDGFKYSLSIDKIKGDYFITNFEKIYN